MVEMEQSEPVIHTCEICKKEIDQNEYPKLFDAETRTWHHYKCWYATHDLPSVGL